MSCGVLGQRRPFFPFFLLRVILIPCGIDKALLVVLGFLICSLCIVCLVIDVVMIFIILKCTITICFVSIAW